MKLLYSSGVTLRIIPRPMTAAFVLGLTEALPRSPVPSHARNTSNFDVSVVLPLTVIDVLHRSHLIEYRICFLVSARSRPPIHTESARTSYLTSRTL